MKELLLTYLTQASTYRGILTVLSGFGVIHMSDGLTSAVVGVCLAVSGLINVLVNEKKQG